LVFNAEFNKITWFDYLAKSTDFQIVSKKGESNLDELIIVHTNSLKSISINKEDKSYKVLNRYFDMFKTSDIENINKIIYQIFTT